MPPPSVLQFELAEAQSPKDRGLFHELLERNHLVLHYDMQDRPELYSDAARQLILELADGQRRYDDLSAKEKQELDAATLEYATQPPVRSHEKKRTAMLKRIKRILEPPTDHSTPEEQLAPFWWLR